MHVAGYGLRRLLGAPGARSEEIAISTLTREPGSRGDPVDAGRPATAVASYVSVLSVSSRYYYRQESSSSAQGGASGARPARSCWGGGRRRLFGLFARGARRRAPLIGTHGTRPCLWLPLTPPAPRRCAGGWRASGGDGGALRQRPLGASGPRRHRVLLSRASGCGVGR